MCKAQNVNTKMNGQPKLPLTGHHHQYENCIISCVFSFPFTMKIKKQWQIWINSKCEVHDTMRQTWNHLWSWITVHWPNSKWELWSIDDTRFRLQKPNRQWNNEQKQWHIHVGLSIPITTTSTNTQHKLIFLFNFTAILTHINAYMTWRLQQNGIKILRSDFDKSNEWVREWAWSALVCQVYLWQWLTVAVYDCFDCALCK